MAETTCDADVRLVRFSVSEKGFRTRRVTLVTTLLDAQKYPVSALQRCIEGAGKWS